jgi:hypothetical protein
MNGETLVGVKGSGKWKTESGKLKIENGKWKTGSERTNVLLVNSELR